MLAPFLSFIAGAAFSLGLVVAYRKISAILNKGRPADWPKDFHEALRLHRAAGFYAELTHHEHGTRYVDDEPSPTASALDVISHDCARLHRAIAMICMSGYSCTAAILARTQMDLMIETMVITLDENKSDLMAYKYLYFASKKGINEEAHPLAERERAKRTCIDGLQLLPEELREDAKKFVFHEKLGSYWYASKYKSPKEVLKQYMPGWEDIYDGLSGAAHGGYIGMRSFRDQPDELGLEPRKPGLAAQRILTFSARFMLDQTLYRAHFLKLDAQQEYEKLRKDLDPFQRRVGTPQVTDEERRTLPTHQRLRPTKSGE